MRGGEERKAELMEKECDGKSLSSSSETWPNGESGMAETSDAKDKLGPREFEKWGSGRCCAGEDSGKLCELFQDARALSNIGGAMDCERTRLLGFDPKSRAVGW